MISSLLLAVDTSMYQGAVDWPKVKAAGVSVAICKASEGTTWQDSTYFDHMNKARAAGLAVGPYHFFRPRDDGGVQADHFLQTAGWNDAWCSPALDMEVMDGVSPPAVLARAGAWCERVEKATGRIPIIYTSPNFWRNLLGNPTNWTRHPLWISHYGVAAPDIPGGWTDYALWQYTSVGRVDGIPGNADLNHAKPGLWMGPEKEGDKMFLVIAKLVEEILGQIPRLTKDVEMVKGPGNGADKKAAVIDALTTLAGDAVGAGAVGSAVTGAVIAAAGAVIDAIVAVYNAAGVFAHNK
jgi:lysozyme